MTDRELAALLERDPEAGMETVMAAYTGLLWKVASGLLQSREDIQDCVSETFSEFYLHRENYDPEQGTLGGYLAVIARRRAAAIYRKNNRELCPPGSSPNPDSLIEDSDWQEKLEQSMVVDQAVAGLDEASQKIIRMKYYEGLSTKEIAESLNVPYETVKKRHTRSMKKLRKLLSLLVIAILLFLAACGVIYVLRHLGVLPGYGVTTDPNAFCCLMEERNPTVETEDYTAWIESARLYNGQLRYQFLLEAPERPIEGKLDEHGIPRMLRFDARICYEDGTPLPGQPYGLSRGSADYFSGNGDGELTLDQDTLDTLRREGRMALELHITDIELDGQPLPDAVIPFTLVEVRQRPLENYPGFYDETIGGFLLDGRMEDGVLTLNVYPISNGTMEFSNSLTLPPALFGASSFEYRTPLTIVGADGVEYTGEQVERTLMQFDNSIATFTFPDAPPGKYTLQLPYVYLLLKQEKSLTWNLVSGKVSNQAISFPGGSFRTVSITELEEPDPSGQFIDDVPLEFTHTWEVAVQCQFDNADITVIQGGYPDTPELFLWLQAEQWARVLFHDYSFTGGNFFATDGQCGPERGVLIYHFSADDEFIQKHDLKHVLCNPAPPSDLTLMILRYDHPMELEFEVTP